MSNCGWEGCQLVVQSLWERLIVEEDDSPEAEELRALFLGAALDPEEPSC